MRPLVLTMQAFGPYKTSETIDFADLGTNKLFLIHGETGSGKTCILDAMVFALYGVTSGGEREAAQMRCESADPALATEVVFEFALGQRTFRVTRRPNQELAAQSGSRLVQKQAYAALWETTDADPGSEGKVLGSKIREVNETIRGLLGFSSEQFRQVVVLPQGKFRDLLAASSDKREEILRQLFRTEDCAALERRLKEKAREVVRQRDELKIRRNDRLVTVGADDDAALAALTGEATKRAKDAKREAKQAEKAAQEAAKAWAAAQAADEAAGAVREAEAAIEDLGREQPRIDELKGVAALARAAEKVTRFVEEAEHAAEQLRRAEAARESAGEDLKAAVVAEKQTAARLQKERKRAPQRKAAAEQVQRLADMQERVTKWQQAEDERKQALGDLQAAQESLRGAQVALKQAKEDQNVAGERVGKAAEAASELELATRELKAATEALDRCTKRDVAKADLKKAGADRDDAVRAFKTAKTAFEAADEAYTRVESEWRAGRAAALARGLIEGDPCPVCGSTDHPAPAHAADEIDDVALDAARKRLEGARTLSDDAKEAVSKAQAAEGKARGTLTALEDGVVAGLTAAKAERAVRACEKKCGQLTEAVGEVADPDEVQADARESVELADKQLTAAQKAERSAHGDLASKVARADGLAADLPEDLRTPAAVAGALKQAQADAEELEGALEDAREASEEARESKVGAQRDAKAAETAHTNAERAVVKAQKAVDEALERHDFDGFESYEAAVMVQDELVVAEGEVAAHHEALVGARGQLKQARAAAKRHPTVGEVSELEERSRVADEASREAFRLQNEADTELKSLKGVREALDKLDRQFEEVAAAYAVIGKLAEVANGQSDGAKVSFQRWVLGAYLDDVLVAATRRLVSMSRGRYRLERQRGASDFRRASGLELAVFDGWSNRSRPAITLSGGESFLAALSLALGLAETVQEQSGGTHLDTVFVDEGFGALDPDALDLAVEALMELKDTGRLVGVISHVPELRQVIDARLEVTGGPGGSSTRFVVA